VTSLSRNSPPESWPPSTRRMTSGRPQPADHRTCQYQNTYCRKLHQDRRAPTGQMATAMALTWAPAWARAMAWEQRMSRVSADRSASQNNPCCFQTSCPTRGCCHHRQWRGRLHHFETRHTVPGSTRVDLAKHALPASGLPSKPRKTIAWSRQLDRRPGRDQSMYFRMVDRFRREPTCPRRAWS
jgi:hypothetical protein